MQSDQNGSPRSGVEVISQSDLLVVPPQYHAPIIEADQTVTIPVPVSQEIPIQASATRVIAADAPFIPSVIDWPQTVDQTVAQVLRDHPSVTMFTDDARTHAGHAWKDPENVLAKVQHAISASPDQAATILASVEASPQAYGELAGGRTFLGRSDAERLDALERVPLFTASLRNSIDEADRLAPSIRETEIAWRHEMSSPIPVLSAAALSIVHDLAQAADLKWSQREPAHELAVTALGQEAFSEVREWRQAVNARLAVPDAIDRIPGLSDERKDSIVATVSTVDTAVREASATQQRLVQREVTIEISTSPAVDITPGI
ncbi:hypothetical protein [Aureimonas sp. SK2]|uniref:hypothetical protein n=1 Tax=Aureimonas sp. SK2 TaxID=3015992 RepID=UPI0024444A03|nr:hypothetical protein [Aureimonas sp. SK2]